HADEKTGQYVVDARGTVTYRADNAKPAATDEEEKSPHAPGPFGRRPLRAAVEDGWPDTPSTAVVARGGALARISLQTGAVLDVAEDAFPERQGSCHAIRLAYGFGFVCGERDGATAVYAFEPPLSMRPVMRFTRPRFVSASSRGALVVRGGCTDHVDMIGEARPYCIRTLEGSSRGIRGKGDPGGGRGGALAAGPLPGLAPPRPPAGGEVDAFR